MRNFKLPLSILFLSMGMVSCTSNTRDNGTIEINPEDTLAEYTAPAEATNVEDFEEECPEVENNEDETQQIETIKQFLAGIYTTKGASEIFKDKWVNKHCSKNMKKILRDEYYYDGEGWGSWLIGGWGAGEEEIAKTMTGITYDGQYYYATLKPKASDYGPKIHGKRIIRFEVSMVNDTPVINSCKWTQDFSY